MEWALATRFQADRDLVVGSNLRAVPLDPSLHGSRTGSKAGFDLTIAGEPSLAARYVVPDPPYCATSVRSRSPRRSPQDRVRLANWLRSPARATDATSCAHSTSYVAEIA